MNNVKGALQHGILLSLGIIAGSVIAQIIFKGSLWYGFNRGVFAGYVAMIIYVIIALYRIKKSNV